MTFSPSISQISESSVNFLPDIVQFNWKSLEWKVGEPKYQELGGERAGCSVQSAQSMLRMATGIVFAYRMLLR